MDPLSAYVLPIQQEKQSGEAQALPYEITHDIASLAASVRPVRSLLVIAEPPPTPAQLAEKATPTNTREDESEDEEDRRRRRRRRRRRKSSSASSLGREIGSAYVTPIETPYANAEPPPSPLGQSKDTSGVKTRGKIDADADNISPTRDGYIAPSQSVTDLTEPSPVSSVQSTPQVRQTIHETEQHPLPLSTSYARTATVQKIKPSVVADLPPGARFVEPTSAPKPEELGTGNSSKDSTGKSTERGLTGADSTGRDGISRKKSFMSYFKCWRVK
jgi:hypothetical protein